MVKLNYKVKAFTILESMVALVIVMIVFSLSSIVVINVTSSGMTKEKQNAYMLVKAVRNKSIFQNRYIDEVTEINGLTIEKTIESYNNSDRLRLFTVVASKEGKKLFESKEIILVTEKL